MIARIIESHTGSEDSLTALLILFHYLQSLFDNPIV